MSTRTLFIVTGTAAWIGGIATAIAAMSCDVETCETDPQPSAIVRFWAEHDSVRVPVSATSVDYQVAAAGGDPQEDLAAAPSRWIRGRCLDAECTQWAAGWDQPGRISIDAEVCGDRYTAETVVELDALACHAQTQIVDVMVDDRNCPVGPERIPPYECEPAAHASVHVLVARRFDDYYMPVDVDMVWFEHEGQTHEARCLQDGSGGCMAWIAGYELPGAITVSTEHCDTVVSETAIVSMIPDSCHVQTEYMMLDVSTRGCLTGEQQHAEPPPPPQPPWDLTTRSTRERPAGAATDLTRKPEVARPPGAPTDLTTPEHFPPPPGSPGGFATPN